MKSSSPAFTETNSTNGVFKASLFKALFKDRKPLLDGYPAVKKGLAFPEPCLYFGKSAYSFKTTDTVDKVTYKADDQDFSCRYKKETGKWDVSLKRKICDNVNSLIKYEERGVNNPMYVFGLDGLCGAFAWNAKMNAQTRLVKASMMIDCGSAVPSLKVAADVKAALALEQGGNLKFNVGACYSSPVGMSVIGFSQDKLMTLTHAAKLNDDLSATVELTAHAPPAKGTGSTATAGLGYRIDKEHHLKVRVNQRGQVQACVTKDFSANLAIQAAGCWDLNKTATFMTPPAFGFKVVTKG